MIFLYLTVINEWIFYEENDWGFIGARSCVELYGYAKCRDDNSERDQIMKQKFIALLCCLFCSLSLAACSYDGYPMERILTPITYFTAYRTIVQTDEVAVILKDSDSQNFRLWIDSCPIVEEIESDISEKWDFKIALCDTRNIVEDKDNSVYYIPHTAMIHFVYINETDNIIQFDNTSYSVYPPEKDKMSFYDGIRDFIEAAAEHGDSVSLKTTL